MPKLILLPPVSQSSTHFHNQMCTPEGISIMSPSMPNSVMEIHDPFSSVSAPWRAWGETFDQNAFQNSSLRFAFWNMDELIEWVEARITRTMFAICTEFTTTFASVSPSDLGLISARMLERKSKPIAVKYDSLMQNELESWLTSNLFGQRDVVKHSPRDGTTAMEIYLRDKTDETLFHVRWRGHTALEIVDG